MTRPSKHRLLNHQLSSLSRSLLPLRPLQLLLAVVVETPATLTAQPARTNHPAQQRRRGEPRVLRLLEYRIRDEQRRVEPDEVEQGERPHRMVQPEADGG